MRSQYQVPFDDPSADGQPSWSGQYTADGGSHGTDTPDRGNTPIAPVSGRPTASAYPLDRPYPGCPPLQAIERFFRNYAVFSGRASRSEFWWPMLMTGIAETALGALATMSDTGVFDAIQGVLSLALLIPSLAVSVRRLHDINLNGAWLIPFAGIRFHPAGVGHHRRRRHRLRRLHGLAQQPGRRALRQAALSLVSRL